MPSKGDLEGVNLTLAPSGAAAGTLRSESGSPVPAATVLLRSDDGGQPNRYKAWSVSDEEGNFEFSAVPFGKYVVEAAKDGFLENGARVEMSESQPEQDIQITLSKGWSVSGFVFDMEGRPIGGADVTGNPYGRAKTDEKGEFLLSGLWPEEPGGLIVAVSAEAPGYSDGTFADVGPGSVLIFRLPRSALLEVFIANRLANSRVAVNLRLTTTWVVCPKDQHPTSQRGWTVSGPVAAAQVTRSFSLLPGVYEATVAVDGGSSHTWPGIVIGADDVKSRFHVDLANLPADDDHARLVRAIQAELIDLMKEMSAETTAADRREELKLKSHAVLRRLRELHQR